MSRPPQKLPATDTARVHGSGHYKKTTTSRRASNTPLANVNNSNNNTLKVNNNATTNTNLKLNNNNRKGNKHLNQLKGLLARPGPRSESPGKKNLLSIDSL